MCVRLLFIICYIYERRVHSIVDRKFTDEDNVFIELPLYYDRHLHASRELETMCHNPFKEFVYKSIEV